MKEKLAILAIRWAAKRLIKLMGKSEAVKKVKTELKDLVE